MKDLKSLYDQMRGTELEPWLPSIEAQVDLALSAEMNAKTAGWKKVVDELPFIAASEVNLNDDIVSISTKEKLSDQQKLMIETSLRELMPWRKGPYNVHGVYVDTEWRSDYKWKRLENAIKPLKGRRVLDVGCGNGYHSWRMLGQGAELVIGIDPSPLFAMQFSAVKHFAGNQNIFLLPLGIEAVPDNLHAFDTVFSMGVFYHRRSPIDHLYQLKQCLRPEGQLVLETLVIPGDENQVLLPEGRYAQMRNVWFIPSSQALIKWLIRCGYKNVKLIDETYTDFNEQRATDWMQFHSLKEFLDANDNRRTVEGYPAPLRAIFTAEVA